MAQTTWFPQEYNLWIRDGCPENTTVTALFLQSSNNIPEEIIRLTNLQALYLKGTGKNDAPLINLPNSIGGLRFLRTLEIKRAKLNNLPDSIGDILTLTNLSLTRSHLKQLPDSIGRLINLIDLDLGSNELTSLPQEISNLERLETLNLSINKLTSLPDSIGELRNLRELNISHNELTVLPDSIGRLTNLINLYIRGNKINRLPDSIRNLTNLQNLILDNNNDLKYPIKISQFPNLSNSSKSSIEEINNRIREKHRALQPELAATIAQILPLNSSQYKLRESGKHYDIHHIPSTKYSNLSELPRNLIAQFSHGYKSPSDTYNSSTNKIKQETNHNTVIAQSEINNTLEKAKEEERKAEAKERALMEYESSNAKGGKRRKKTVRRRKTVRRKKTVRKRKSMKRRTNKK